MKVDKIDWKPFYKALHKASNDIIKQYQEFNDNIEKMGVFNVVDKNPKDKLREEQSKIFKTAQDIVDGKTMKEIKCPLCGSSDDYDIKGRKKFECTNCLRIYDIPVEKSELDWKEYGTIDIYNDNYFFQIRKWGDDKWYNSEKYQVVDCIIKGLGNIRYKLKPLEDCKITKSMAVELLGKQIVDGMGTNWFIRDGHKVEIIE